MNAPIPHIGQTMQQKRALAHYGAMAAQAQAERIMREERERAVGAELLSRIRLHDLGGCAEVEQDESIFRIVIDSLRREFGRWWLVAALIFTAYVTLGLLACALLMGVM